ncbi:hypothetical protein GCM10010420_40330 [Streptomyces glaucosporus]|uniref:Uncharacterized protein n=1 Tax=Streptomyces glaucosporus TaxID=284044 RepID=A0ABN3INA6_9ACTN
MSPEYAIGAGTPVTTLSEADRLLWELAAGLALPEDVFGCTHLVHGERPHIALSFAADSEAALRAVRERLTAEGYEVRPGAPDAAGRAVLYPGARELTGTLTVADLLSRSAIDRVTVLGAPGAPPPHQRISTRGHVRPQWRDGELVLAAMPAAGGTLVPFEVPDPTPCCADH